MAQLQSTTVTGTLNVSGNIYTGLGNNAVLINAIGLTSGGSNPTTLSANTTYTLTVGNQSFVFTTPAGATLDGTGSATTAAKSDHTHTLSIASGGSNPTTLSANTTYTLTAGGNDVVFTTPAGASSWSDISNKPNTVAITVTYSDGTSGTFNVYHNG